VANREDTKYYQPSFFDTCPEFDNLEELERYEREKQQEDKDFPFWAELFDYENDLDADLIDDDAAAIDQEFNDAIARSNEEDFEFFPWAGQPPQQELDWQEVFEYKDENENVRK